MDIIQLIKLLKKNVLILLLVPLILAGVVWYLTQDEVRNYKSSTTLYTGVASGLSMESLGKSRVDFMGSKIEFDNILNIFKARETQKEVALRLYAQGLSLNSWDPRYISRANFIRLHTGTPQYIKNMVVKKDSTVLDDLLKSCPLILNDTAGLKNKQLLYHNKYHLVENGETLFSISDRFDVPVSDLMEWNSLTTTTLELNQRLIVKRVQKLVYDIDFIRKDTIDLYIPDTTFFVKTKIDSSSFNETVRRFREYAEADDTNYIYRLLNKRHLYYSIAAISSNKASRIQGSDLVSISYTSPDPGITAQTLHFLIYSFKKYYRKLKENQSDQIVAYFEKRVNESSAKLMAAENKLLKFNQDNNIINYYEQTRHISDQKEQLDKVYYDEKMKLNAADSVIKHLESQLNSLKNITGINQAVLEQRNELSDLTYKIAINELNDNKDPEAVNAIRELRVRAKELKQDINSSIDSIFRMQYSVEGVNQNDILGSWLKKTIEYEESKATLAALYERKKEFQKTYEIFAPLGAKLKRVEREIDIYEQQYLQHLHSLNQAKLKQQNLEFKSNIKVIDPPYFPLKPESSKRSLFIVAAALVGFILVLFLILALEYFDKTLKMPVRAEKFVGKKVSTAFPVIPKNKKSINFDFLQQRAVQLLHQGIVRAINKDEDNVGYPIKILFFSTQITEGKSMLTYKYAQELRSLGYKVLILNYSIENYHPHYSFSPDQKDDYFNYTVDSSFFVKNSIEALFDEQIKEDSVYDFIVLEIPAIVQHAYPPKLIREVDFSVLVTRANRTWQKADQLNLKEIESELKREPLFLLNGINPEYMQEFVGEIPKKRSRLRRIGKKLVRLQIFERYQLRKW